MHQTSAIFPNPSLSIVWLMATVGRKSISKKQTESISVSKVCQIITKDDKIQLRVKSSLLLGVSKVLLNQYQFILNDIVKLHSSLKQPQLQINLISPTEHQLKNLLLPYQNEIEKEFIFNFKSSKLNSFSKEFTSMSSLTSSPITGFNPKDGQLSKKNLNLTSGTGSQNLKLLDNTVVSCSVSAFDSNSSANLGQQDFFDMVSVEHEVNPDISRSEGMAIHTSWELDLGVENSQRNIEIEEMTGQPEDLIREFLKQPHQDKSLDSEEQPSILTDFYESIPEDETKNENIKTVKVTKKKKNLSLIDEKIELSREEMIKMREQASFDIAVNLRNVALQKKETNDRLSFNYIFSNSLISLPPSLKKFYSMSLEFVQCSSNEKKNTLKRYRGGELKNRQNFDANSKLKDYSEGIVNVESSRFQQRFEEESTNEIEMMREGKEKRRRSNFSPATLGNQSSISGSIAEDFSTPGSRRISGFEFNSLNKSNDTGERAVDRGDLFDPLTENFFDDHRGSKNESMGGGILFEDEENSYINKESQRTFEFERDIDSFQNYLKEIMRAANTNFIFLNDLIPEKNVSQAARMFYFVLTLTSRGDFKAEQIKPFGDIKVTLS